MSTGIAHEAGLLFLTSRMPGASTPPTVRWRGDYYQHNGVLYRHVSDEDLESQVTRWVAQNPSSRTDLATGKVRPIDTGFIRDALLAVRAHSQVGDAIEPGS